jgi:site-specific recombinase XerC
LSTALVLAAIHQPNELAERWQFYIRQTRSLNTIRAYRADWQDFQSWCELQRGESLPAGAATIAAYITCLADRGSKASTIQRRLTTISQMHDAAGFESPTKTKLVRTTMSGIRRTIGVAQTGKQPLLTTDIRSMCDAFADDLVGLRDRALILLGFAGGFRRSELAGLRWHDLGFKTEGLIVSLTRSKTDQEGSGRKVGIPYGSNPHTCPVRSLSAWREARKSCRSRSHALRRPQPTLRPRDSGCDEWRQRTSHHEPNRPSQPEHGAALHSAGLPIPGKRGVSFGSLTCRLPVGINCNCGGMTEFQGLESVRSLVAVLSVTAAGDQPV